MSDRLKADSVPGSSRAGSSCSSLECQFERRRLWSSADRTRRGEQEREWLGRHQHSTAAGGSGQLQIDGGHRHNS